MQHADKRGFPNEQVNRPKQVVLRSLAIAIAVMTGFGTPATVRATPAAAGNDQSIATMLGHTFANDHSVPSGIRLQVAHGVVYLQGIAPNLPAKDRAGELAGSVSGVRGVVNRLQVRPNQPRTDQQLVRDVSRALRLDHKTVHLNLNVVAQRGVVVLLGTVNAYAEADLALGAVSRVRGVREVSNNMTVKYDAERLDADIKLDIENRLYWDSMVAHRDIHVTVQPGHHVKLSGYVGSVAEKYRAWHAAWVEGVATLEAEQLKVVPDESRLLRKERTLNAQTDRDVAQAVANAIPDHQRAGGFGITVSVDRGVVELRGAVDALAARWAAAEVASTTRGARTVHNRVHVRRASSSDGEVGGRVRALLRLAALTAPHEINVRVTNQIVELRGLVDEQHEKVEAERLSACVYGVRMVKNYLSVRRDEEEQDAESLIREHVPMETETFFNYSPRSWEPHRSGWRWRQPL